MELSDGSLTAVQYDVLASTIEHHHLTYGWINPLMGLAFAAAGSFLGLSCARYARAATGLASRLRWIALAALAIGGVGIWMMHFIAMIGFTVPTSDIAYNLPLTAASFALAVLAVGLGLFMLGTRGAGWARLLAAGPMTGIGVVAMHYTGMAAVRVRGDLVYDARLVAASVLIAVVAATVALKFTAVVDRRGTMVAASAVMAVAVVGMHYTGMTAVSVAGPATSPVEGIDPLVLLLPILVLATLAIVGLVVGVLSAPNLDHRYDPDRRPGGTVRLASPSGM
jgi:NO-binding membrane sensor protein with MHYT domain